MWGVAALLWTWLAGAQPMMGVSVLTDASSYASGAPIDVTIHNDSGDRITRGGLDCDDVWPLALERAADDGSWQAAAVPRHQCVGVTGVLVAPGQVQEKVITVPLDPGTYRINYTFDMLGMGMQNATAYSDPFQVMDADASGDAGS